jgi:hypothetical protein
MENRTEYVSNMDLAWAAVTRENLLWARSVVFSRAFTLRWGERHVIALVPLFDMLDHSPTARWEQALECPILQAQVLPGFVHLFSVWRFLCFRALVRIFVCPRC